MGFGQSILNRYLVLAGLKLKMRPSPDLIFSENMRLLLITRQFSSSDKVGKFFRFNCRNLTSTVYFLCRNFILVKTSYFSVLDSELNMSLETLELVVLKTV